MAGKAKVWARRVAEWRASGLTSEQFCEGRDFTAGGLRHWAYRLGDRVRKRRSKPEVRLVRVVRIERPLKEQGLPSGGSTGAEVAVVVEVGQARVLVRPGFERTMSAALLEAVAAQAGGR